jgi:hypothetical protein
LSSSLFPFQPLDLLSLSLASLPPAPAGEDGEEAEGADAAGGELRRREFEQARRMIRGGRGLAGGLVNTVRPAAAARRRAFKGARARAVTVRRAFNRTDVDSCEEIAAGV